MTILPADRVELFDVTCAAGTAKASYTTTSLNIGTSYVVGIELVIPDGHNGYTGIALGIGGAFLLPATNNTFYVGNNEKIPLELTSYPDSGAWQAFTYNTGVFAHAWQVRFLINDQQWAGPFPPLNTSPSPVIV